VIPDFMIQGGDPLGTAPWPWLQFGDEFHPDLVSTGLTCSRWRTLPGTNGSQFFITARRRRG